MENKFQAAKNYNFIQDITIDSYIDAKDQVNHWCVAQVCDIDNEKGMIKIHFEGWGSRYDEVRIIYMKFPTFLTNHVTVIKEELSETCTIQKTYNRLHWLKEDSHERFQDQPTLSSDCK